MDHFRRRLIAGIMFSATVPMWLRSAYAADCSQEKKFGNWTAKTALWFGADDKPEVTIYFGTKLDDNQWFYISRSGLEWEAKVTTSKPDDPKRYRNLAVLIDGTEIALADNSDGKPRTVIEDPTSHILNGRILELFAGSDAISITRFSRRLEDLRKGVQWSKQTTAKLLSDYRKKRCSLVDLDDFDFCYVTTAACHCVGLADDCWELTTLRRFRDGYLARRSDGTSQIAFYNDVAPKLVARVRAHPLGQAFLLRTYWTCILPCSILSSLGFNAMCHRIYLQHFHWLIKKIGADDAMPDIKRSG